MADHRCCQNAFVKMLPTVNYCRCVEVKTTETCSASTPEPWAHPRVTGSRDCLVQRRCCRGPAQRRLRCGSVLCVLACKWGGMMLSGFFLCSQHFFACSCFCTLYFSPAKPETDYVGEKNNSALSSITTFSWYQQVILRRRLKLILALFCLTSSSGNSKPMQIAERRSHEDIR